MQVRFDESTIGDFNQRYNGCFGVFHQGNKARVVKILEVDGDMVEFKDAPESSTEYITLGSDYYFTMTCLQRRWWPTSMGPILTTRVPARQYRRGICSNNTTLRIQSGAGAFNARPDFSNIKDILMGYPEDKCPDYLSPWMAVQKDILHLLDKPIARISDKNKILFVPKYSCFTQEVVDLVAKGSHRLVGYTIQEI